MKFRLKPKRVTAVQWKGWPHQIKGMTEHSSYPQLGSLPPPGGNGYYLDVYQDDWVLTFSDGTKTVMTDYEFNEAYERVK